MATDVYIEEYATLTAVYGSNIHLPAQPTTVQKISATGTSGQSAAFAATTHFVCVIPRGTVCGALGANPTATSSSRFFPTNVPRFMEVTPGEKLALIEVV